MTASFSERLAAAKVAARPTLDVQVLLDADLSENRERLLSELEAAKTRDAADPRLASVPEAAAVQKELDALTDESEGSLITLRFTRLPGDQWAEVTARCPARVDAPIDSQYGYNMHAACRLAAPLSGVLVDADKEVPLNEEEWRDLFATISGVEFISIIDVIYEVNAYAPAVRLNSLKKALANRPA